MQKTIDARIMEVLGREGPSSGAAIARELGVSRQTVSRHLKRLVLDGEVRRVGRTRGTLFTAGMPSPSRRAQRLYIREGLEEHSVLDWARAAVFDPSLIRSNVSDILAYALTEMVNNAIEHSGSTRVLVSCSIDDYDCRFEVRDWGAGAFRTIARKLDLTSESDAVMELLKGKKTIDPSRHSGEGIFFTTRTADSFRIRSHRTGLIALKQGTDISLEAVEWTKGTLVEYRISAASRRSLRGVFDRFAPEEYDYRFERTVVHVELYTTECISRSQARRMLSGTEGFSEIVLDLKGVRVLGQAFCDEVFRVFPARHPGVRIEAANVPEPLRAMVSHAGGNSGMAE